MQGVPLRVGDDDDIAGGVVPELEVDDVAYGIDGGIPARVDVAHRHAVVPPLHDLQVRQNYGVVQGGGELTDAAAGLLDHFAALVGAGRFPAVGAGALAQGIVHGEDVAGLEDGAVDLLRAEADVILSIGGAARKTGLVAGPAAGVLSLQHLPGHGGLQIADGDVDRRTGQRIGFQDGFRQSFLVDAAADHLVLIGDLIVLEPDGGVHRGLVDQTGQIGDELADRIGIIGRGRGDLFSRGDLLDLGHEGVIGDVRVAHEGKSGVHRTAHVILQLDADRLRLSSVFRFNVLLFWSGGGLGSQQFGIDGVVVLLLRGRGAHSGDSLNVPAGSGVGVRSVR